MKKCNLLVLLIMPLLLLLFSSVGHASSSSNSNDAVANERPPLTADELAEHWKLDCRKIAAGIIEDWVAIEGRAEKAVLSQHPDISDVDLRELQLCAFIYNARDTGRYQPCPNYEKALLALKSMTKGEVKNEAKEFPALIGSYLNGCGKD